jgi:predicted amidohydrolase
MTARVLTIATAAMGVVHDPAANLAKYLELMDEASDADLLVLPEQSLQGYMFGVSHEITKEEYDYHHSNAEPVAAGKSVEILAREAERRGLVLVFGMTELGSLDLIFNTAVVLADGEVAGSYRKTHAPGDETQIYRHGGSYPAIPSPVGRLGISICYDMAFPEVARCLTLAGAEILVMPTAWPRFSNYEEAPEDTSIAPLGEKHDLLCRARAAENQRVYVSSNQFGHDDRGLLDYYGHSGVVDPNGRWIEQLGYEEGVAKVTVDVEGSRVDAVTGWFDLLRDRRPETYGSISSIAPYEGGA